MKKWGGGRSTQEGMGGVMETQRIWRKKKCVGRGGEHMEVGEVKGLSERGGWRKEGKREYRERKRSRDHRKMKE